MDGYCCGWVVVSYAPIFLRTAASVLWHSDQSKVPREPYALYAYIVQLIQYPGSNPTNSRLLIKPAEILRNWS